MHTQIISILLALAPSTSPPVDVSDAETCHDGDVVHVTTFDADGEVSATIVAWSADGGAGELVTFPDGHYIWFAVADESMSSEASDPAIVRRFDVLEAGLRELSEEESNDCLFAMIGLGGAILAKNPYAITAAAYAVHKWCVKAPQEGDEECDDGTESEESGS
jgi:hypothetical protein